MFCAVCAIQVQYNDDGTELAFRNTNQVNIMHKNDHNQSSKTLKLLDVKVSVKVLGRLNAECQLQA